MSKKFDALFEHVQKRFTNGGVVANDYVKIVSTDVPDTNKEFADTLKDFKNCDTNLRVLDVYRKTPNDEGQDGEGLPADFVAVIGKEMACGLYPDQITVPVKNLEVIGYNYPPEIPDSWKVSHQVDRDGEPKELKK